MTSGPNMGGLSRKHVMQACDASLKRLGVDVIDLYWIHRFDEKTPIDETMEALNDLVRWGKVRYLGASSGPAWRMAQALETSEKRGWSKFVGMQNHYNLMYREEEREMIPLCNSEGVGLVPWSPLARGLLARSRPASAKIVDAGTARAGNDKYTEQLYDSPDDWNVVDAVEKVAKARGASMSEVALAWLMSRPGVAAPIIGATKIEHLETAIKAVALTSPMMSASHWKRRIVRMEFGDTRFRSPRAPECQSADKGGDHESRSQSLCTGCCSGIRGADHGMRGVREAESWRGVYPAWTAGGAGRSDSGGAGPGIRLDSKATGDIAAPSSNGCRGGGSAQSKAGACGSRIIGCMIATGGTSLKATGANCPYPPRQSRHNFLLS